jgi:hypothetical protein
MRGRVAEILEPAGRMLGALQASPHEGRRHRDSLELRIH